MNYSSGIPVVPVMTGAGSAGKTTTVVSLAALLAAEEGRRVLVVDLDSQATATWWLGVEPAGRPTVGDVLQRRATVADAVVTTPTPGVQLVPADRSLDGVVVQLGSTRAADQRLRLALEAADLAVGTVVLVDCPGSTGLMAVAAAVAATTVVTTTLPTLKELDGIPQVEALVADVAEAYRPGLRLAAIVPCQVPPTGRLYAAAGELLAQQYPHLVTPPVRRSVRVPEAHAAAAPLPGYAPTEPVTHDYRQVLHDLHAKGIL